MAVIGALGKTGNECFKFSLPVKYGVFVDIFHVDKKYTFVAS